MPDTIDITLIVNDERFAVRVRYIHMHLQCELCVATCRCMLSKPAQALSAQHAQRSRDQDLVPS